MDYNSDQTTILSLLHSAMLSAAASRGFSSALCTVSTCQRQFVKEEPLTL